MILFRLMLVLLTFSVAVAFQNWNGVHQIRRACHPLPSASGCQRRNIHSPTSAKSEDDDDVSDTGEETLQSADWREFRARLVLGSKEGSSSKFSSSSWAYDSGHVIEPGSIILAKVEPDFCYFGLNQQYFHKSVMLVTEHEEGVFTKGIILNRPTNLYLGDDDFLNEDGDPYIKSGVANRTTENSWRIWFGGDVRSLYSDDTEIVCLHSIDTSIARNVSEVLLNNIMMTNYEGAMQIIDAKQAEAKDFWMFAGYAGWNGGQLLDELQRESWYMVSADSETVWKELIHQRDSPADPRNAGIKTWGSLMCMIGREEEAKMLDESFADLTLKEWATAAILFNSTILGRDEPQEDAVRGPDINQLDDILGSFSSTSDSLDKIVKLALTAKDGLAGSLIRGSAEHKSPFLLSEQKFHHSVQLILQDDGELTIGIMLNHPMTKTRPLTLPDGRTVEIPIRYGGSFGIPGVTEQPTIFLHAKSKLRKLSIGEPVGRTDNDLSLIWICSEDQVIESIAKGHASQRDFMCIEGFSIWSKDQNDGGILGDLLEGKFEVVDPLCTDEMWLTLLAQSTLSLESLDRNCRLAFDAWGVAGKNEDPFPPCVYESTVTVSELADDALRYWIEAFRLGGVVSAVNKYSVFE